MVEDFLRQSPLAHLGLAAIALAGREEAAGVALAEQPFRTVITLRGDAADAAFTAAVAEAFGPALPGAVGEVSGEPDGRQALRLGPDEWWLTDAADDAGPLVEALERALAGRFASAVDTSDNWFAFEVSGPRTLDLLAKACPLDLPPPRLRPRPLRPVAAGQGPGHAAAAGREPALPPPRPPLLRRLRLALAERRRPRIRGERPGGVRAGGRLVFYTAMPYK